MFFGSPRPTDNVLCVLRIPRSRSHLRCHPGGGICFSVSKSRFKRKFSDVEIEQKEEQTDEEKQRATVNARTRQARNGIQHKMRKLFEAG